MPRRNFCVCFFMPNWHKVRCRGGNGSVADLDIRVFLWIQSRPGISCIERSRFEFGTAPCLSLNSGRITTPILSRDLFFGLHLNFGRKNASILGEDPFFFGLLLVFVVMNKL